MPRNGSGVYTLPGSYEAVTGETITATQHNAPLEDIETALTGSVATNGSSAMTSNLSLGDNRITDLADGTADTDAVSKGQMDDLLSAQITGFITGLTLSNNSTDATNDIDIAAGSAASDTPDPGPMTLESTLTKRLDASWSVGTGNGGLDTGSVSNGTYHVWLIKRSDTGVVDALFSGSATSPTMPANYDQKRRIGSIVRDGGTILAFTQIGDHFHIAQTLGYNSTSAVADTLLTLTVPTGIRVRPLLRFSAEAASGAQAVVIGNGDASSAEYGVLITAGQLISACPEVWTNTSGQIRYTFSVLSGSASSNNVYTLGWIDPRGKL